MLPEGLGLLQTASSKSSTINCFSALEWTSACCENAWYWDRTAIFMVNNSAVSIPAISCIGCYVRSLAATKADFDVYKQV